MAETLRPGRREDLQEIVRWAAGDRVALEIVGQGTRAAAGGLVRAQQAVSLSAFSGVTLYEPDELVLTALAGTPVAEIENLLAEHNQHLAFEPHDHGPLSRGARGRGTIGGIVATNASGPRRISDGAARDHVLGIHAVSGRGELFKSGGRVVKNVTGYDLSRGLSGSWGTLAVFSEITLKVLPRPERTETIVLTGLDDRMAIAALCAATGSACAVSGAAHVSPQAAADPVFEDLFGSGGAKTLMRIEGFAPSVADRASTLAAMMAEYGVPDRLSDQGSARLWLALRDAEPLVAGTETVWRISVAPTEGPAVVASVQAVLGERVDRFFYDWSGGLIWLSVKEGSDEDDGGAETIRDAVSSAGGGHATLFRSSPVLRAAVPPFQPEDEPLAALSRRLKDAFDPAGILNPGRMGSP